VRKSLNSGRKTAVFCVFAGLLSAAPALPAADASSRPVNALTANLLQRAEAEVARIEPLVADGTLPKSSLDEAKAKLADAQDQEILYETLYGEVHAENMTDGQAQLMLAAAQRRVDRQQKIVDERQKLLESGIMARSELAAFQDELDARRRVLELARNRVQLMSELRQMAETEQRFENLAHSAELKAVMIRYDGSRAFRIADLPRISQAFEGHFHHSLPVSAVGETMLHRSMGLDHRNRVDVALNPDSTEGLWLRHLLEQLQMPYLAFRSALAGAATAPHIHIGLESTRLKLARR
jgi:hypothetical protein